MMSFELNEKFLDEVENFTEKKLSQRTTILSLFEIVNQTKQFEKFNDLIFTAKYVNGLIRSIKIAQSNPQISNVEMIKKDFSANMEKARSLISEILSKEDSDTAKEIRSKYIEIGEIQFGNFISLIDDLEQIKKYSNYLKRNN